MAHYLEYDKGTGRIVSEIISATVPKSTAEHDVYEIPEDLQIDTTLYAVRNGQLVKLYETNEERLQRELLRRENIERVRERIKSMMYETCIAILDENDKALNALRREYRELKVYL